MVDLSNPEINLDSDVVVPEYTNSDITLVGTVTDSNPESNKENGISIKASVNKGTEYDITPSYDSTNTKWRWNTTIPTGSDELKNVKIIVTDAAGKKSEMTQTFTVDTTAPTVTVTDPGSVSGQFTLSASVFDTGKGIPEESSAVQYSLTNNNNDWHSMTKGTGSTYSATISTTYNF